MNYHCIIIGAGASGLMAGCRLAEQGKKILIIEARERIGGRAYTITEGFSTTVEMGAEFVHGALPVTLGLLKEHSIAYEAVKGDSWRCEKGRLEKDTEVIDHHKILEKHLLELTHDMPVKHFVATFPPEAPYPEIKDAVTRFTEGYDTADTSKASTFALREEWLGYSGEDQYRIEGGYIQLMDALRKYFESLGGKVITGEPVSEVKWKKDNVHVVTKSCKLFEGQKVLITVPAGIMQLTEHDEHYLNISPPPAEHLKAYRHIGFGKVIKVVIEFKTPFWKEANDLRKAIPDLGMMFSDTTFPTWWVDVNSEIPLVTGWLGGPNVEAMDGKSTGEILNIALESLAYIFKEHTDHLKSLVAASKVVNWNREDFTQGAYKYNTVDEIRHLAILKNPVEDTVYFAGEALYQGPNTGTVEAALVSGLEMADIVLMRNG